MAQLDARPTGDQEVAGSTPRWVGNILLWRFDHEIFSMVIPSLLLVQEGQLSVVQITGYPLRGLSLPSKSVIR